MAYMPEVEVTLTSAKDLKNINWRHGPLSPYAVVWVDPDRKVTTRVDDEGDTSPTWNEKLVLSINRPIDDETTLNIDIVHANAAEDVKPLIGSAKLRLQEVLDEGGGYGAAPVTRKLDLRRPSGRPQGKIYVDVVIRDGRYAIPPPGVYQPAPYNVREYGGVPVSTPYGYPYTTAPPAPYTAAPTPYGAAASPYTATPYGAAGSPYTAAPPPPYGVAPPYTAAPPGGYPYGAAPPTQYGVASGYGPVGEEKKTSKYGGMGTGLAVGAVAGALGGLALAEGFDQLEDHIAEEAAEKVEDDLAAGDDNYDDDGDDDGDGDGDW